MRRYRRHDKRSVEELNGFWDFAFLGNVEPDEVEAGRIRFPDRMAVPGCFDATPLYAGKRGLTAYRTRVLLKDETPHRLIFELPGLVQTAWHFQLRSPPVVPILPGNSYHPGQILARVHSAKQLISLEVLFVPTMEQRSYARWG